MWRIVLLLILFFFANNTVFSLEVAVTIDDLPAVRNENIATQTAINKKILYALAKYEIKATAFVNEIKLYFDPKNTSKRIDILRLWVANGHELGNHTYSHKFFSKTNLEEFEADVIKGEKVSKKIMQEAGKDLHYFRYPYLDTGKNIETRKLFEQFLIERGYTIASITINTDDWKFNKTLLDNPYDKEEIIAKYLEHTRKVFRNQKFNNKNVKQHIWLLHANLINSYVMEDLLKIVAEYGYNFVPLQKVLPYSTS